MKGRISEVFESIQGEGLYVGERQLFVRFFGCNLRCKFCDTKLDSFREYEPQELLAELNLHEDNFHSVSFTGGEPLLQKDFLKEAMELTRNAGYRNYLETNGTLADELQEVIGYLDIVAMDVKLPSSTGEFPYWRTHKRFLEIASRKEVFVKIVICNSTHTEDVINAFDMIKKINPAATVVLQPETNDRSFGLDSKIESYKVLCEERALSGCSIPQVHKIAGWK